VGALAGRAAGHAPVAVFKVDELDEAIVVDGERLSYGLHPRDHIREHAVVAATVPTTRS
jgi:hypothetical protein